ncbi:MAG: hypothetical protein QGG39_19300, partial [Candidatus Poribacteria bacterium]|nr:hypothetical protein [Candidatus Poribacteria bacterium]
MVAEPTEPDLATGLVAYYPFNGNANDESGNGNHGEVVGVTFVDGVNGSTDKSINLDGDDHVKVDTRFPNMRDASVSFWFRGDEKNQVAGRVAVIQTASLSVLIQNYPDNHVHHGHKIYVFYHDDRDGNSSLPWSSERLYVPKFIEDEWNHIVVRINDSDEC